MSRLTRTLIALVLFLALCGPVVAQAPHGRSHAGPSAADPLSWLWERIAAPVGQFLKERGGFDPNGLVTPPPPQTDSRGACDPNGASSCTDGRGGADPNG